MLRAIIITGSLIFLLLVLNQLLSFSLFHYSWAGEGHAVYIAVLAIAIGLGLGKVMAKKNTSVLSKKMVVNTMASGALDEELSARELDVLVRLAEGKGNQAIADELFVSLNTVKTHLNNIYRKLQVNNRTQALIKAKALAIID